MLMFRFPARLHAPLFCLAAALLLYTQAAEAGDYRIAPPPAWVEAVPPEEPAVLPLDQVADGVFYLLTDHQVRVDSDTVTRFRHNARKVLNSQGAKTAAQIAVEFDPEYETLTLHAVRVHREGGALDRLPAARIAVLQRETQREYLLYDGARTVEIILDDVRVGDVVEYSYSISGQNPVFSGRYYEFIDLGWSIPVHKVRRRLLWPTERPLHLRPFNTGIQPQIREKRGFREYLWSVDGAAPVFVEGDLPSWYNPFPGVQLSETGNWAEVGKWALDLYRTHAPASPELTALADRLGAGRSPREKVLAVLRFAQEEIRYLGLEMGPASHAPSDPSEVLRRRFGDCKDKTRLALALLQRLGIEAHPALVNTDFRQEVAQFLPSPTVFNHVILRVQADGSIYWLDPTNSHQGGDLETLDQARFGMALVIAPGTKDLTSMTPPPPAGPNRQIEEVLDLRAGVGEPAKYSVRTLYSGPGADSIRAQLAGTSREELRRQYLDFYAGSYPTVVSDGELEISDDLSANRVVLLERYTIPGIWHHNAEEKRRETDIQSPELGAILKASGSPQRTMPLALHHPLHVRQHTEVLLPEDWDIQAESKRISDAAFLFDRKVEYADRRLLLTSEYRSLLDHLPPEKVADYFSNLERARDELGYLIYAMDEVAIGEEGGNHLFGDLNWPIAIVAVILAAAFLEAARRLYRWDPPFSPEPLVDPSLKGISGWLLLPALGVLINPVRLAADLIIQLRWIFSRASWLAVTAPGSEAYHPVYAPLLTFELAGNIGILVFSLLLPVLFFKHRSSLPRLYIFFLTGAFLFTLIDHLVALSVPILAKAVTPDETTSLVRQGFYSLIWGLYFARSRRVRTTFTVRRPGPRGEEKLLQEQSSITAEQI